MQKNIKTIMNKDMFRDRIISDKDIYDGVIVEDQERALTERDILRLFNTASDATRSFTQSDETESIIDDFINASYYFS